jgi:hypothetical protein
MRNSIIVSLAALTLSILNISTFAAEKETIKTLLATVSTKDGINKKEAENIAKAYFLHNIGCGSFSGITEIKNDWVVEGLFGYAGQPIKGFFINKQSGAITSPVGPSYAHFQDLLQ